MASSLRQFCRCVQKHAFFVVRFSIYCPRNSQWKVHIKCRRTLQKVFEEAHFIVNLHSFLQPLALPRHIFPPSGSFAPHFPRQNNFQNSSPLDTSEIALVCIFSSILNHSQTNQKNSIIKVESKQKFRCYIPFLSSKINKKTDKLCMKLLGFFISLHNFC